MEKENLELLDGVLKCLPNWDSITSYCEFLMEILKL